MAKQKIIRFKRNEVSGSVPTDSDLAVAELGFCIPDGSLYFETLTGDIENIFEWGNIDERPYSIERIYLHGSDAVALSDNKDFDLSPEEFLIDGSNLMVFVNGILQSSYDEEYITSGGTDSHDTIEFADSLDDDDKLQIIIMKYKE